MKIEMLKRARNDSGGVSTVYKAGRVYDVARDVAEALIALGFARPTDLKRGQTPAPIEAKTASATDPEAERGQPAMTDAPVVYEPVSAIASADDPATEKKTVDAA